LAPAPGVTMSQTNKFTAGLLAGSVFGLALTAAPLSAEGISVDLSSGVVLMALPENRFFADRGEGTPFTRNYDLDTNSRSLAGAGLGLRLETDALAGGPFSLEFDGAFVAAVSNTDVSFEDGGAGERFGWVVLDGSSGFGTPAAGDVLDTQVSRNLRQSEASLRARYQVGTQGEAGFGFYAGPLKRWLDQDFDIAGQITNGGSPGSSVVLTEELDTEFTGAVIGVALARQVRQGWQAEFDLSATFARAETSYSGDYAVDGSSDPTETLSGENNAAWLNIGVDLVQAAGGGAIWYSADLEYLSGMPTVNYGSVPTDASNGVLRLEQANAVTLRLGVEYRTTF
jgi:hypothetical protein